MLDWNSIGPWFQGLIVGLVAGPFAYNYLVKPITGKLWEDVKHYTSNVWNALRGF